MARPKPKVILENIDRTTYKSDQILSAVAIYAVFWRGNPINIRTLNALIDGPAPKYKKVSFSNPGHAHNLANKLNAQFKCNDFAVYKLVSGEIVYERPDEE